MTKNLPTGREIAEARYPRAVVRCAVTSNQSTTSISANQNGLTGSRALRLGDVVWLPFQTNPAEDGLYRVDDVTAGVCTIYKLPLCNECIADVSGLFVQVSEGTLYGGQIYRLFGAGSFAEAKLTPKVSPSLISFNSVAIEDYVVSSDSVYPLNTANWYPVFARMLECMYYAAGECCIGDTFYYRITRRIDLWTRTILQGTATSAYPSLTSPRILADGCAAFFAPGKGETYDGFTWTMGIEVYPDLRDILISFVNGTDVLVQYGVLFHAASNLLNVTLRTPYGRGFSQDSTTAIGGANNSTAIRCKVYAGGVSAYWANGGDANNWTMVACQAQNYATLGHEALAYEPSSPVPTPFPGDDWGFLDDSFLGCTLMGCSFSAFHNGGIYAFDSLSAYYKQYCEAGTESDIVACDIHGGNQVLRVGGNSTFLPSISTGTDNSVRIPVVRTESSNSVQKLGGGSSTSVRSVAGKTGDTTGFNEEWNTTGGDTGFLTRGWGTANAGHNEFWSFQGSSLGTSMHGDYKGHFIGTGFRQHVIARANLPATGVPLTAGSLTHFDGPYPVGSLAIEPTAGLAAFGYRVIANSGTPLYTLTWGAVANPAPDTVALAAGNQTRIITDGGAFRMAATTTTGAMSITLGVTGNPKKDDVMSWDFLVQLDAITLINGGPGGTGAQPNKVLAAGFEYAGFHKFDGTDWICQGISVCV